MTPEIIKVYIVFVVTVILFVTELLRVDVVALLVLVALGWLGLVTPSEAISGFSSNAVIAMLAVMILGYGVERSGVMTKVTKPVMKLAGTSETKLILIVSLSIGILSGFMQNIGATVLFLPAILRISKTHKIRASRLLMPMGFSAILGGTITLVGSGPLIVLNDLLRQSDLKTYSLFSVTPIGLTLLIIGVFYFLVLGRFILPRKKKESEPRDPQQEIIKSWDLSCTVYQCHIPEGSSLIGRSREELHLKEKYRISIIALLEGDDISFAPWRYTRFASGQSLGLLGSKTGINKFVEDYGLEHEEDTRELEKLIRSPQVGFAEVIIPPRSKIAGKSIREITLRKVYSVEPIMLLSGDKEHRHDFSDEKLQPGNTLVVHGSWENIKALDDNRNFVVATPIDSDVTGRTKPVLAILCLLGSLGLTFAGFPLSLALLTGALAMIILGVIKIEEAYKAVDWKVVFLLAGLIPLGIAMENTGAAKFTAEKIMGLLQGSHPILILGAIAVLTTIFTLFISNVAATVLLVPLVIVLGRLADLDPRGLSLLVAVCAANSFLLPTHQVNALLMSPGGYHNSDYLKTGGLMTVLFIVVVVLIFHFFII